MNPADREGGYALLSPYSIGTLGPTTHQTVGDNDG